LIHAGQKLSFSSEAKTAVLEPRGGLEIEIALALGAQQVILLKQILCRCSRHQSTNDHGFCDY
jgi:hypothetical protein